MWSINERLGCLCSLHGYEGETPGKNFPYPTLDWIEDILDLPPPQPGEIGL